jgi:stearoyl-CoA desaturase (delta-9 desaturase)
VSRQHRVYLLATTALPPAGLLAAIVLLWNRLVSWQDLTVLAVFYVLTGLGVAVGFHRLLTHRSFETYRPIKLALAGLGMMAAHGSPIVWVAHHRQHHTFADSPGDPHSPHVHEHDGFLSTLRSLWFAHAGWRLSGDSAADPLRYARDLITDRPLARLSRHFIGFTVLGVVLAGLLDYALTGSPAALASGMLWGGLVRLFLVHHIGFTVNSVGHFYGPRRFNTPDESRNLFWLALPSLGETWHNNHHAFPTSARHGLRWWEIDPSALFIAGLKRVGLAWNVVQVSPEAQERRRLALAGGTVDDLSTLGVSAGGADG